MNSNAMMFAMKAHKGQKDDAGEDYFWAHLYPVMCAVSELTKDVDIQIAALLHDVLEDTDVTYDDLVSAFNVRIANLVYEVTAVVKNGKKEFPNLYSPDAYLIKLVDRASNVYRMQFSWPESRQAGYLKRMKL